MEIKEISKNECFEFIRKFHYSRVMPKLTKITLGGFVDGKLVGAITLGWGTRPLHTIRKLFPSLTAKDYYEIGKMALDEEMPRNSESEFLSKVVKFIKQKQPQIKIIFTWADGIMGKPGYVYQASNFLYGGFITTDVYITDKGEKVHPRMTNKIGGRPNKEKLVELGWKHIRGRQFRYIYFTCDKKTKKKLQAESIEKFDLNHPKQDAICWSELKISGWTETKVCPFRFENSVTDFYKSKDGTTSNKLF